MTHELNQLETGCIFSFVRYTTRSLRAHSYINISKPVMIMLGHFQSPSEPHSTLFLKPPWILHIFDLFCLKLVNYLGKVNTARKGIILPEAPMKMAPISRNVFQVSRPTEISSWAQFKLRRPRLFCKTFREQLSRKIAVPLHEFEFEWLNDDDETFSPSASASVCVCSCHSISVQTYLFCEFLVACNHVLNSQSGNLNSQLPRHNLGESGMGIEILLSLVTRQTV